MRVDWLTNLWYTLTIDHCEAVQCDETEDYEAPWENVPHGKKNILRTPGREILIAGSSY